MSEYLVISSSLRPKSLSRQLAEQLARDYASLGVTADLVDLRDFPLPICDGDTAYSDPNLARLEPRIEAARVIALATPVYNFDASAAAKNLVELTGSAWENKIVAFLCAAGGSASYMSVMSFANSLMLDFRCVIVPRFVYATGADFSNGTLSNAEIAGRIRMLAEESMRLRRE
ncbi:MAG: NAD(P)H-dependent oxidoreductase [Verrucomicrobiota bacterium]|nr:NAD(P)H-dependent oxidoreductase [Verrucomicrobiota bacterium]